MKLKKICAVGITAVMAMSSMSVFAENVPTTEEIASKSLEFASQYPYKDGDAEKSLSFDIPYTSGFETRSDGVEYECPAIYRDSDAMYVNDFDLNKGEMLLYVNGKPSIYGQNCVCHNGITLVPVEVFDEVGCVRTYNDSLYVTTLSKNDTVLEIMPYLIGMRKNQADGYYVPLSACARYVDGKLYVPIRAVAEELGVKVGWNGENNAVTLEG